MTSAALPRASDRTAVAAALVGVLSSVAFALVAPPVGDLFAARAREYASRHGVGLTYWFSWFDGTVPGHYSVLLPYLDRWVGSGVLLCVAAAVCTALLALLLRGVRFAAAAQGAAVLAVACNLWSGRVAFLVGAAVALVALLAVRSARPWVAAALTALACLLTPVTGAFLALGLLGVLLFDPLRRRAAAAVVVVSVVAVGGIGLWFGSPGPETFRTPDLLATLVALLALLLLRPERRVGLVLWLSLPVCLAVGLIPNGLGSNFQRMACFAIPVACLATARVRRPAVLAVALVPLAIGVVQTASDLRVAADPLSSLSFYDGVARELDTLPGTAAHRVEVVPNGTHGEAFLLLGHAQLARGHETQSDQRYNGVLNQTPLTAAGYRRWLDDNAVGYVIQTHRTRRSGSPEDSLVRDHRPGYLRPIWHDAGLTLYAVAYPTPIVPAPGRVLSVDESSMRLQLPRGVTVVRVRWARFVTLHGAPAGTRLSETSDGWLRVALPRACTCRLTD